MFGCARFFENFDVIVILTVEARILNSLNTVSLLLQSPECELSKAADLLGTALRTLQAIRANFDEILEKAEKMVRSWRIQPIFQQKRRRKVPKFADDLSSDERLSDARKYFQTQIFLQKNGYSDFAIENTFSKFK